jgi:hypothetical protein
MGDAKENFSDMGGAKENFSDMGDAKTGVFLVARELPFINRVELEQHLQYNNSRNGGAGGETLVATPPMQPDLFAPLEPVAPPALARDEPAPSESVGLAGSDLAQLLAQTRRDARAELLAELERDGLLKKRKPRPETPEETAAIERIFAVWQRATGYTRHRLTPARRKILLARLRERHADGSPAYTVDDLVAIVEWAPTDDFYSGRKTGLAWLDFKHLMGSGQKVDQNLLRVRQGNPRAGAALIATPDQPTGARRL